MTATADLVPISSRAADYITQTTAVEQARAVAEVQAAVTVAQRMPRDLKRAEAEMEDSCARLALAARAFYEVPNRGRGPSVHLARELARIWGNIDYGVRELRRDDEAGESEVQAFAWDQQSNVRSTRTFIVPHARMKKVNGKQTRERLIDLGDIYLSNQNIGARAVRECVFTVLPTWFTEAAQDLCRTTLENGGGKPLSQRVEDMLRGFAGIGVDETRIEQRIGRKRAAWTGADVADMGIVYMSITRDGLDKDEAFPQLRVTAAEVMNHAPAEPPTPSGLDEFTEGGTSNPTGPPRGGITEAARRKLFAVLAQVGIPADDRGRRLRVLSALTYRRVESSASLSRDEAKACIDTLESIAQREDPAENLAAVMEMAEQSMPPDPA